ncbi:MAG: hypothetical protein CO065_08290 [Comamonadaceae bacterium CG_4_9_14_0_8_um_filter_57_21]|nr:MAG: hypothetical protein CO065_08290 [Comamonadaceae bacterium CG_4_9_14_0_8_um_filter_57_21]
MHKVSYLQTDLMLRTLEAAEHSHDNPIHKPPGGGNGGDTLEVRVSKLESVMPTLATRADIADLRMEVVRVDLSLRSELIRVEGSIRADMHKEFTSQTWRIIGAMMTFGTTLVAATYFIAHNIK